jgi:hypothetical protein
MTDDAVRDFLEAQEAPEHIVEGGLEGLVEQWENAVEDVEQIYPLGLDDYLDDMDGRQLIEGALTVAAPETRRSILPRLRQADERMKKVVVSAGRCLWGPQAADEHGWTPEHNWWYFTRPREPGPELEEDLASR